MKTYQMKYQENKQAEAIRSSHRLGKVGVLVWLLTVMVSGFFNEVEALTMKPHKKIVINDTSIVTSDGTIVEKD